MAESAHVGKADQSILMPNSVSITFTPSGIKSSDTLCRRIFENPLLVSCISSCSDSQDDLLNLRLVNHLFQQEATKQLRRVHRHVKPENEARVAELLSCLQTRQALNLTPFPFSAFKVYLRFRLKALENFAVAIGPHIDRYNLSCFRGSGREEEYRNKVIMLLLHSPNLTELYFGSNYTLDLCLSEDDMIRLPTSFPHLSVIGISTEYFDLNINPVYKNLLILLMIKRAPHLKIIKLPWSKSVIRSRIIKFLVQNRPDNMPSFSLDDCVEVMPRTTNLLDELIHYNLVFRKISIRIIGGTSSPTVRDMERKVTAFLTAQRRNLTDLSIDCFYYRESNSPQFTLPSIQTLKDLTIKVPEYGSLPILPFVGNPYPNLRRLCLDRFRENFETFETCLLPSVLELDLRCHGNPLGHPSWRVAFPNLTTLHIEIDFRTGTVFRSTLTYILTHFTDLLHLNFDVIEDKFAKIFIASANWECWDILTGGVPPLCQNSELAVNAGVVEEPMNGIYRVPSLQNMKALKTLRFFPRLPSNLDAILHMTRTGQLVPLQKLALPMMRRDYLLRPQKDKVGVYQEELSKVHTEVIFNWSNY